MKVKHPVFRFHGRTAAIPFLLSLLGFVTILLLVSCDTGHYNFKPESMYWLQFRGPNASGIAPENADPPIRFNALTNLLWKTEMLPGWSSPCIVNDRIFLTGYNDSDSLLYTVAINRENGEILWRGSVLPHGYYDMHPINTYANASVASDGEKIFASFPNYGLIAYDLDGNMLWDFTHETLSHFYGGGCSPLIADSVVIIMINSNQDPRFMAIDCQTGDSVWTIRITEHKWVSLESSATPVLWNDLLILHLSEVIAAYNVIDGNVKWWIYTPTSASGTPVIIDDLLIVNTWFEGGEEGRREKDFAATFMEDHGMLALPLVGSGERSFTDIMWKVNKDTPDTPSPLVVNENVFFIKNGGIMTVINRESGEVVHKGRIGAAGSYLSSPMLAGNRVYTCSYNGTIMVLSADDYSVLAHNKLRGKIGASPVAVDDVLYVRTDKYLYAFRDQK